MHFCDVSMVTLNNKRTCQKKWIKQALAYEK